MTGTRLLALARCGAAAACLLRPAGVVRLAGGTPDAQAVLFARVLGGRDLAQGVLTAARPARTVADLGAAVDALHAVSVVALAAVDAPRRRPALANALLATVWVALARAVRPAPAG